MACIVYQTDKKTGVKYAYESVSYWDKEKKQPRSKRKYIGKVDPLTGEIIRTGEERTINPDAKEAIERLRQEIADKDALIASLQAELSKLNKKYRSVEKTITKIAALAVTPED